MPDVVRLLTFPFELNLLSAARGVVRVPSVNNYYVLLYYVNKSYVTVFRVLVMIGSTNIAVLVSVKLTTVYSYIGCFFPCTLVFFMYACNIPFVFFMLTVFF